MPPQRPQLPLREMADVSTVKTDRPGARAPCARARPSAIALPKPMVDKLYAAIQEALKAPELQQAFAREGAASVTMSTDEFAHYIESEIAKWGRVVKEGNITAQ